MGKEISFPEFNSELMLRASANPYTSSKSACRQANTPRSAGEFQGEMECSKSVLKWGSDKDQDNDAPKPVMEGYQGETSSFLQSELNK